LANGEVVQRYMIEAVIGRGGFGITYRARHTDDQIVVLKEYFPQRCARRRDGIVMPATIAEHAAYHDGLGRFLSEARALRRLWVVGGTGGGVVKVLTVLERNGTGYVVMEHLTGQPLDMVLEAYPDGLAEEVLNPLARHLVCALGHVHGARFRHGDIKPANVMLRENGRPVLIDFGAARSASAGTMLAAETAGHCYAPIERHLGTEQGPFSDVYALGATLYHAIGGTPIDALTRHRSLLNGWADPLPPAIEVGAGRFPVPLLRMIDRAMAVPQAARPQSAAALLAVLDGIDTDLAPPPETARQQVEPPAIAVPNVQPALGDFPVATATTPVEAAQDARLPSSRRQRSRAMALSLLGVMIVAGLGGGLSLSWLRPTGMPLASAPVASLTVPAGKSSGGPEPTEQDQVPPPSLIPPPAELPEKAVAEPAKPPTTDTASLELGERSAVDSPKPAAPESPASSVAAPPKPAVIAAPKPAIVPPLKPASIPPAKLAAATVSPPVGKPIARATSDAPRSAVPEPTVQSSTAPADSPSAQPQPSGLPDLAVGSRIAGPALIYPQTLEESGREGSADIRCTIDADGMPSDCKIVELMGPAGFGQSALAYISGSTYHPARRSGVNVDADMTFHVMFRLGRAAPGAAMPASAPSIRAPADAPSTQAEPAAPLNVPVGSRISGPALIYPQTLEESGREGSADVRCTVDADGTPNDCKIVELTGPDGFGRSALAYIGGSLYHPARRDGVNVSEDMTFHVVFRLAAERGR
jgi:TonB family protein